VANPGRARERITSHTAAIPVRPADFAADTVARPHRIGRATVAHRLAAPTTPMVMVVAVVAPAVPVSVVVAPATPTFQLIIK
jgi:hypothetical protein